MSNTFTADFYFSNDTKNSQQSNYINKSRLRVLQARQQVLTDLLGEATKSLSSVSAKADYGSLVKNLILQALFTIFEPEVVVLCRKVDLALVEGVVAEAKKEFDAASKMNVRIVVDKENFVSEARCVDALFFCIERIGVESESNWVTGRSAGGVIVHAVDGRIRVANTLEIRMELLADQVRFLFFFGLKSIHQLITTLHHNL